VTAKIASKSGHATGTCASVKVSLCEEKERWSAAVEGLGGSIYQSWEWGVARSFAGWIPWRVLVERDGHPAAALQVLERRLPVIGASLMYAPRPVPPTRQDRVCWAALVDRVRGLMRERRAVVLRADPPVLDTDAEGARVMEDLGFRQCREQQWSVWGNLPRAWMIVDIHCSEGEILSRMRDTYRRRIRKRLPDGIEIVSGSDDVIVRDLYSLLNKTAERREFPVLSKPYFAGLRDTILAPNRGTIFVARLRGSPVAAVACSRFGQTCYYLYGGFDFEHRHLNLNQLLHWRAIQWARLNGCREYNMIGAGTRYPPSEGNVGFDLYNFKLGFGAELRYYAGYFDLYNRASARYLFRAAERQFGGALYDLTRRLRRN
jgi:peptidoglycan pentaglycine glycine transferase (the first glycine)